MSFLESPWLLLLVPLVARVYARDRNGDDPWRTRVDLPLAVVTGLVTALLTTAWLARYHLRHWPLTASDFAHYCQSVASVQSGGLETWVPQRSVAAGYLAGLLSRELGVLGGLVAQTFFAQVLTSIGLYLWGRAAHGRVAGVASALLSVAVAPLVVLSRTVTFYPMFVAACALCSAGAMLAVRYRTLPALFAGGMGVGIVLLADVRGLYWGLAGLAITLIGAVPPYLGHLPKRLLYVFAPIVASWIVGGAILPDKAPGLDYQTWLFVQDALVRGKSEVVLPPLTPADFYWGRGSPLEIPGALARVAELTSYVPADLAGTVEVTHARETYLLPWLGPVAVALALWAVRMRLRPWTLIAFYVSLVPYVVVTYTTATTLAHPRYLAVAMLGVPVALGVPLGAFVGAPSPLRVAAPLVGVLLLLVLGVVPNWLSPVAGWRIPFNAEAEPRDYQVQTIPMDSASARCVIALARDMHKGRTWTPYTYPVDLPALPNVTADGKAIVPGDPEGGHVDPVAEPTVTATAGESASH